jgi:hypothetical protein
MPCVSNECNLIPLKKFVPLYHGKHDTHTPAVATLDENEKGRRGKLFTRKKPGPDPTPAYHLHQRELPEHR